MQRQEIESRIRQMGFVVSPDAFWKWAECRLIPRKLNAGVFAQWPQETLWEAMAAAFLIRQQGWTFEDVRAGRFTVENPLLYRGNPLRVLSQLFHEKGSERPYLCACGWLIAVLKARAGKPLDEPCHFLVRRTVGGGFEYAAKPPLEDQNLLPESVGPGLGCLGTLQMDGEEIVHPSLEMLDRLVSDLLSE